MTESTDNLAQRLATLERKHARLKWLWGATIIIVALAYPAFKARSTSPSTMNAIHAAAFIVDGPNGHPFARLDSYGLHLYSQKGKPVVDLVATKMIGSDPVCMAHALNSAKTFAQAIMQCPERRRNAPSLVFRNLKGSKIVALGRNSSIGVALVINNGKRAHYQAAEFGQRSMAIDTPHGDTYIGPGYITVSGSRRNGRSVFLASDDSVPGPIIEITGKRGHIRTAIGVSKLKNVRTSDIVTRSPSSIVLFNKKGDVLWEEPAD